MESGFKAEVGYGVFFISITEESDVSLDGGFTFVNVTNTWELNQQAARDLLNKLKEYLGET